MSNTHELRVHRRTHRLHQSELAHLIGVSTAMIVRMEQGTRAQIADIEAMISLEVVFGKPLSQIFASLFQGIEQAVMRRATSLEETWFTVDDAAAKTKLKLLSDMVARASGNADAV